MRSIVEVRRRALRWERVRYSGLKEAAFVRGGRGGALWDFNRLWLGSYWKEEYLWDDRKS